MHIAKLFRISPLKMLNEEKSKKRIMHAEYKNSFQPD